MLLDGKYLQDRQIMLCAGTTNREQQHALGFVEITTENAEAVAGLRYVTGGVKGLHKAVKGVFGNHAQVQRCTWHKQENTAEHLNNKEDRERMRCTMPVGLWQNHVTRKQESRLRPCRRTGLETSGAAGGQQSGQRHRKDAGAAKAGAGEHARSKLADHQNRRECKQPSARKPAASLRN